MTRSEAGKVLKERLELVAALRAAKTDCAEDLVLERALTTALERARKAAHDYETADDDDA